MTGSYPASQSSFSREYLSLSVSPLRADSSRVSTLRSLFAFSSPAAAASLKDLSPRPPMSYARPTLTVFFAGVLPPPPEVLLLPPHAAIASATTATPAVASSLIPRTRRKTISFPKAPLHCGVPTPGAYPLVGAGKPIGARLEDRRYHAVM